MKPRKISIYILVLVTLMLISLACSVSIDTGGIMGSEEEESPEVEVIQLEDAEEEQPAVVEPVIEHTLIPGNPGTADQEKDDIDTSNTAADKTALGDSYRLGNVERPFTMTDMTYQPQADLLNLQISKGTDFYYFTFELKGVDPDSMTPSAYYAIEFDTDFDGRGDLLLWAMGDGNSEWNIDDVMLLRDSDDDVGGSSPVVPDNSPGNGYDEVLFSKDVLTDPDAAWKRVDPTNPANIQLAVKMSYVDNTRFYWKAWSDSSIMDPSQFDYNDRYSEPQAGSANKNSEFYPLGQMHTMDSTCWIAYNLEPTGTEVGGCVVQQPTAEPGCVCGGRASSYGVDCCTTCGFYWDAKRQQCQDPLY